jgi:predicted dehydrogenase
MLARDDVDAVILCTPTQMHAAQAIACMDAIKHVEVEIPLADSLADAEAVLAKAQATGLTCMVGHTRRFNPSHQYIHGLIAKGELHLQQMDVQTYFFRRRNINAKGEARSWTDHLLWHHAAHTVDRHRQLVIIWHTGSAHLGLAYNHAAIATPVTSAQLANAWERAARRSVAFSSGWRRKTLAI